MGPVLPKTPPPCLTSPQHFLEASAAHRSSSSRPLHLAPSKPRRSPPSWSFHVVFCYLRSLLFLSRILLQPLFKAPFPVAFPYAPTPLSFSFLRHEGVPRLLLPDWGIKYPTHRQRPHSRTFVSMSSPLVLCFPVPFIFSAFGYLPPEILGKLRLGWVFLFWPCPRTPCQPLPPFLEILYSFCPRTLLFALSLPLFFFPRPSLNNLRSPYGQGG